MFNHALIELDELERQDTENGRYYLTPGGNRYPSVTTVLGKMSDDSSLDNWREWVGEEEANRVLKRSGRRGTAVHLMLEKFVLNQDIDFSKEMPLNVFMYKQIKKELEKNLSIVFSSEGRLYSDRLKIAGSVDLVGKWKGTNAIIDFKTSGKNKERISIPNYFLQTAIYSWMFYERTGIACPKLVVMIAVESENDALIYEENARDWIPKAFELCSSYHENN